MDTWTPLFGSIIDSSIWMESKETRLLWITMLAKKNREGFVRGVPSTLARDAGLTLQECLVSLEVLRSPDPQSKTKDHEGRRIQDVEGGWMVLNHYLHRNRMSKEYRREYQRVKQAEYRRRRKVVKVDAEKEGAREAIADGLADVAKQNSVPKIFGQ